MKPRKYVGDCSPRREPRSPFPPPSLPRSPRLEWVRGMKGPRWIRGLARAENVERDRTMESGRLVRQLVGPAGWPAAAAGGPVGRTSFHSRSGSNQTSIQVRNEPEKESNRRLMTPTAEDKAAGRWDREGRSIREHHLDRQSSPLEKHHISIGQPVNLRQGG